MLDGLTEVYNRRFLQRFFEAEWKAAADRYAELTIVIIDLDHFKEVNDTYGHLSGDQILIKVAEILTTSFRESDFVVRYGGDEFVIILPAAGTSEATRLAERARTAVKDTTFTSHDHGELIEIPVSFSIGVGTAPTDGASGSEVLAVADLRMLEQKRQRKPIRGRATRVIAIGQAALLGSLALSIAILLWWRSAMPEEGSHQFVPTPAVLAARAQTQLELQQEIDRLEKTLSQQSRLDRDSQQQRALESEIEALEQLVRELESTALPEPEIGSKLIPEQVEQEISEPEVQSLDPIDKTSTSIQPSTALSEEDPGLEQNREHEPEKVIRGPRLLHIARPKYPAAARRMRREATLELEVLVGGSGKPIEAVVLGEPSGYGFDEAARRAALASKYQPGTVDGAPADLKLQISVHFRLQ